MRLDHVACCILGLWPKHLEALKSESSRAVSIGRYAFAWAREKTERESSRPRSDETKQLYESNSELSSPEAARDDS
jgi:hypothetical protein